MQDLFREVGDWGRRFAVGAILFTAFVCCMPLVWLGGNMLAAGKWTQDGKPLWAALPVLAFLTFAPGWIAYRLLRERRAANGVTVMPTGFIEVFGIAFMAGILLAAIGGHQLWMLPEAFGVPVAMIAVRSLLPRRAQAAAGEERP